MKRAVISSIILAATVLAMSAAGYWAPSYKIVWRDRPRVPTDFGWRSITRTSDWRRFVRPGEQMVGNSSYEVHWPILIGTQSLILLVGGGVLTFVVRRERRRR